MRTWIGGEGTYDFFLYAPQEYYATISNQYYADSELLVRFAIQRAQAGNVRCMDHMLLPVYYLSQSFEGKQVPFYRIGYKDVTGVGASRLPIKKKMVQVHRNNKVQPALDCKHAVVRASVW